MTGGLKRPGLHPDCGFSGPEEGGMILLDKITLSWFFWNGLTKHMRQKILLGNAGPERLTSDQYMSESWSPHSQFPGLKRKMWVLALGLYLRCCHRLDVSSILLNIKLCGFLLAASHFCFFSPADPDYEVFLNASKTPKFSDDPTELECRITNVQDTEADIRFSVSWYYRQHLLSDDVVVEKLLATMDADWTLLLGDRSRERTQNGEIIFSKKAVDTFSLWIQWTSENDRGDYFCVISAWSRHRNNNWVKIKDVTSASVPILWATQGRNLAPIHWKTWAAKIFFSWVGPSARRPANGL